MIRKILKSYRKFFFPQKTEINQKHSRNYLDFHDVTWNIFKFSIFCLEYAEYYSNKISIFLIETMSFVIFKRIYILFRRIWLASSYLLVRIIIRLTGAAIYKIFINLKSKFSKFWMTTTRNCHPKKSSNWLLTP